jgi:hypothetical protein
MVTGQKTRVGFPAFSLPLKQHPGDPSMKIKRKERESDRMIMRGNIPPLPHDVALR